jgi:hypothetical protein
MKNAISRDTWGKIQGNVYQFWNNEDESYRDMKISSDKIIFPQHKGSMHGEVITYSIDQLNKN